MSRVLICLSLSFLMKAVICGDDLCKNGALIDSIAYINDRSQWFFTSGGHYWVVKQSEFPPREKGKKLPGGFKRGDAAMYMNTLDACKAVKSQNKPQEKEIHLVEVVGEENKVLIFDLRVNDWANNGQPQPYSAFKTLSQAQVDWTQTIDSMFVHKMTNIIVVQNKKYCVVDFAKVCTGEYGEGKAPFDITDFAILDPPDALSAIDDTKFYIFKGEVYWTAFLDKPLSSKGQMSNVHKGPQNIIATDFFGFKDKECKSNAPNPTNETSTGMVTDKPEQTVDMTANPEEATTPSGAGGEVTVSPSKDEESSSGFIWIIIGVIVVIVIIVAIILIALMAMRKKKSEDNPENANISAGTATASKENIGLVGGSSKVGTGVPKTKSSLGYSPSTMSTRSTTDAFSGNNPKPVSKASSVKTSASKK